MPTCGTCGQPAHWSAYVGDQELHIYRCKYCKPDPWTSGSKQREGVYYRLIEEKSDD